jgi:O-antigen/teichoic acid export membrane protein
MTSLKKQTLNGVKWTTLNTSINSLIGPLLLLIKAWFLTPEEFAYVAIILIAFEIIQLLEDFGISQAIIQKDKITVKERSSLFTLNLFFGITLMILTFVISPYVADIFKLPKLVDYLSIVGIIAVLSSPSVLFRAYLQKYMLFKQVSVIAIIRNFLTLIFISLFLYLDFGVWAIVYSKIITTFFATIAIIFVSFKLRTGRIILYFSTKRVTPFLRFGFFVSMRQIINLLTNRLDELFIGYFLSPDLLGLYHFGKRVLENFRSLIQSAYKRVFYTLFSKIKLNKQKLTDVYLKINKLVGFLAMPTFAGITLTAHLFVPLIFGEQWNDAVIIFQLMSISMIFNTLTESLSTSLLYAVNKPDLVFYIDVISMIILTIGLFLS